MELIIQKGIKIPNSRGKWAVFAEMEVGDSVFVPGAVATSLAGGYLTTLKPKKFTRRTLTENGVKGVRVWRIA